MYKNIIKRVFDFILSSIAIILLAFPMIIIAVAIKVDDPGSVIFKQKRVGKKKNGKLTYFTILKFRSMKSSTPHNTPTYLLENPESYITRVGKFLRKSSLDELPQIFNIWLGQMSIIGPRPVILNETDLIEEREKFGANDIRPGLTGWAQINGRDELDFVEKAKLDGEYAVALNDSEFKGVYMDLKCFFATIFVVLKADGVVEGKTVGFNKLKPHVQKRKIRETVK